MNRHTLNFSVKNLIGHYIGVAQASLRKDFIATLKVEGISFTPEQFTILMRLNVSDGISQKDLAEYAARDNASITRVLDILEKEQFIIRKRAENDRRTNRIYITKQGAGDTQNRVSACEKEKRRTPTRFEL